ncbi:hypothetical protein WMY93_001250 [Mugilogobius chulae]|uniref:DNA repair-scaffolding protein n=1 Tax=Mugilogobius chulae TaxID=88201 RepID=A0AAW0QC83_9GOBI
MSSRKRKKYSTDIKCVYFPDELDHSLLKAGKEKDTALSVASSIKSWEKCGDSFLNTPITKKTTSSGKTLSAIRKLSQALAFDTCVTEHTEEEPLHIAWSDSDKSEDETKDLHVLQVVPKKRFLKTPRYVAPFHSYTSALDLLTDNYEEPPVIDTDSDIVQSEEEVERDSGQLISDCDSNVSNETLEETTSKSTNPLELEISGYESDDANNTMTSSTMNCDEGRQRSVSHWVRSAQALLQTPQKVTEKQSKTPEDSAKKRRKFQSGGLAERLHRLQCRQRSAISFWRHKSVSENSTAVDRPGVLVLEVLEVQEECSMRLVLCERRTPPAEGHHDDQAPSEKRAPLLVLFNKETVAQLNPLPKDVIHIYPPWQSLSVEGVDYDIILNTHFSQKVSFSAESAVTSLPSLTAPKRTPYSLDKVFGLLEGCMTTEEPNKQDVHFPIRDSITGAGHCQSLLDAIEALGQAGSVGRLLCVLVQDSYGMFSMVQLHLLASTDDLHKYSQMWQGRTCLLRNIKVVQRVTRERHTRLFGLIDSLWPPLVPLKYHGGTASLQNESRAAGPPPSFCYLLCGQESSVEPSENQPVSPLYFPPTKQTLKELMQKEQKFCRCSFVATVLYNKKQAAKVGQGNLWLALTDPSLQEEQLERPLRRTVTLCVNTSCVLTSSVLEALNSSSVCRMSFIDVVKEHGMFVCAEQSVIKLCPLEPDPTVSSSLGSLDQPVRLDVLDSEVTPSSLCVVSGVIVGVDENTAYSWPACNYCGSDHLEMLTQQRFHCVSCKSILDKPETKAQLEVILSQSSLKDCTVKIKV